MRGCTLFCAVIGCALTAGVGPAGVDDGKDKTAQRIATLIRQLGHDQFAKREAATKELDAIGEPALDALRKAAAADDDPEIQRRAEQLIRAITGRIRGAAARRELDKLQGTWYTVSVLSKNAVSGEDKTDTITYNGNQYVQKRNGRVWAAGTVEVVDPTASPKQIDYLVTEGQYKGFRFRSIFTCDGDEHRICSDDGNNQRPTEFSGKAGFLRITKREKK